MYIQRQFTRKNIIYQFDRYKKTIGTTNYTMGILPPKIRVVDEDIKINTKVSWISLINNIPILNLINFSHYIYLEDKKCGKIKKRFGFFKPEFDCIINEKEYLLKSLGGNDFAVYISEKEVLRFNKRNFAFMERNTYDISFNILQDDALIMLFCIFIDITYFNNNASWSYLKYERIL